MDCKLKQVVYDCYGHSKARIRYHVILVTKYRRKCLNRIKSSVFDSFKWIEDTSDIKIHIMTVDKDHVHLIISFPHKYSITQTINRLKQGTTRYLYIHNLEHLKKFYWKKKNILWSSSYFISTIGYVSDNNVTTYIKNQG